MSTSATSLGSSYLDERANELNNVIRNTASTYCDATHPCLGYDDLVAEGRSKLAEMVANETWKRFVDKPRYEFFAFFKTAVNNHIKSLVVRYRLTSKRGYDSVNQRKQVDLSIDAEDGITEISDRESNESIQALENSAISEDLKNILDPVEFIICQQQVCPNAAAMVLAYTDTRGTSRKLKVTAKYRAAGIGVPLSFYNRKLASINRKIKVYMQNPDKDSTFWSHVKQLEQVFGIQMPPSIDKVVVRRMMAIAARDQYDRVTEEVSEHLKAINVPVPEMDKGTSTLRCYGILYKASDRACQSCDLNSACSIAAQNLGLGNINISSQLMPKGQLRCATSLAGQQTSPENASTAEVSEPLSESVVSDSGSVPNVETAESDIPANQGSIPIDYYSVTGQILLYLDGKISKTRSHDSVYYFIRKKSRKPSYIFSYIGQSRRVEDVIPLRVCNPSATLALQLVKVRGGYYIPSNITYDGAIAIVESHINERGNETAE